MSGRLRLGIVNDIGQIGGIEQMLLLLTRMLPQDKFKTLYFPPYHGPMVDMMAEIGAEVIPVARPNWYSTSFYYRGQRKLNPIALLSNLPGLFRYVNRLEKVFRAVRPDIIHSAGMVAQIAAGLAAKRAKIPHIAHLHDIISRQYMRYVYISALDHLSDQFVAISVATSRDYPPDKTILIPNGVDINRIRHAHDIRPLLGIASGQKLVGMVGRLTPWKGQKVFLHAASQVAQDNDSVRFILVGDDSIGKVRGYRAELDALANQGALRGRVAFLGFREDVLDIIASCDVLVHASTSPEPFGLVIIEAMALGKPVIATAVGGPLEIIEDNVDGLLVEPHNPQVLAKAIRLLVENNDLAERIGYGAQQKVFERFTSSRMLNDFIELYYKFKAP